ncbi:PREDICTED: RNA-binding protein MEX3A-like, partial [Pterocles gutturalis]|uniref:RNA-binding protein MEX3A-like n=1 Tax=Pterocles gutturalis TaxID=240206 RepID=UPI000528CB48
CKIKALRAKTNTYIKTPVRGEEPVFMVTGRREDVAMARREIISAAEHFSMIRASRNKAGTTFGSAPTLPAPVPIRARLDPGLETPYSEAWQFHTPAPGCKPLSTFRQNSLGCIGDCSVDPVYETPRLNDQNDFNYGYLFPNYGVNKQDLYYGVPESGAPMWAGQENTNPVS